MGVSRGNEHVFNRNARRAACDGFGLVQVFARDHATIDDRNRKAPRYAAAGVPEVWLIDLGAERIEVYRDPGPNGYSTGQIAERGDALSSLAFPDVQIAVDDVLP